MTQIDNIIDVSKEDNNMRRLILRFLERISYDENYIKLVKEIKANIERIKVFNQFKIIKRNKLINNKKS